MNRGLLTVWRRDAGITRGATVAAGGPFAEMVVEAPKLEMRPPQPDVRRPGRIDVVVDGGHAVLSGDVDPALAVAVVGALRRPR